MAAGVTAAPAQASQTSAAAWQSVFVGYATKSLCIDDGQQYQREGWAYRCIPGYSSTWVLQIWV
jgi:hypothetical protein